MYTMPEPLPDFQMPDFQNILAVLEAAQVCFVLIGGLAMMVHGSAHITVDIDICYARDRPNLEALIAALKPRNPHLRGAPEGLPFFFDTRTFANVLNLTLATDIGDVYLLGEVPGVVSFDALWERSIVIELEGIAVHVASLEDLIAMKRAAGRPKDQTHLMELERLRELTAHYDAQVL
jgi:predicted nucleotidyltransferase